MKGTGKSSYLQMIAKVMPRVIIYDPLFEHGKLGTVVHTARDIGNLDKVVVQPADNTTAIFEEVCRVVWSRDNVFFIADEVEKHEDTYHLTPWFSRVLEHGRHKGIGGAYVSRRPARMNSSIPALSDHIIVFRLFTPNDIQYFYEIIGDAAERLKTLPDYYFMHYDHKTITFGKTRPMR